MDDVTSYINFLKQDYQINGIDAMDPTTDECLMFDTCPTLDTDACPECVSGNPGCAIEDIEKGEGHHE